MNLHQIRRFYLYAPHASRWLKYWRIAKFGDWIAAPTHPVFRPAEWESIKLSNASVLSNAGSGTVLITRICQAVIDADRLSVKLDEGRLREICWHWNSLIHHVAESIMSASYFDKCPISPVEYDNAAIICYRKSKIQAIIFRLPWYGYVAESVYASHKPPSPVLAKSLTRNGHTFVHTRRNPLDVLMSTRRKGEVIGSLTATQIPEVFYRNLVAFLYRTSAFSRPDIVGHTVDYDRLIKDPLASIMEIGIALKRELQEEDAHVIWENLAFKQLPGAPDQHFQGGGSNKGIEVLTDAERRTIEEFHLESWLDPLATNARRYEQAARAFSEQCSNCNDIYDAFGLDANSNFIDQVDAVSQSIGDGTDLMPLTREEKAYAWTNIGPCIGTTINGLPVAARDEVAVRAIQDIFGSSRDLQFLSPRYTISNEIDS